MTRGFTWTEKRDRLLRELRRQGLNLRETARAIGCDVAHVRERLRDPAYAASAPAPVPPAGADVTRVPRPVAVVPSAARRPLIDLSRAPSAMEQRFSASGSRA